MSEKAAYVKVREKIDSDAGNKRLCREKKMMESEKYSEAFMAAVAAARTKLGQLEMEFKELRATRGNNGR